MLPRINGVAELLAGIPEFLCPRAPRRGVQSGDDPRRCLDPVGRSKEDRSGDGEERQGGKGDEHVSTVPGRAGRPGETSQQGAPGCT